jgi:hypothetical protein
MSEKSPSPTIRALETVGWGSWTMVNDSAISLNIDQYYRLVGTYAVKREGVTLIVIPVDDTDLMFYRL